MWEARVNVQRASGGLDVHARSVVACGLDRETGELFERWPRTQHYGDSDSGGSGGNQQPSDGRIPATTVDTASTSPLPRGTTNATHVKSPGTPPASTIGAGWPISVCARGNQNQFWSASFRVTGDIDFETVTRNLRSPALLGWRSYRAAVSQRCILDRHRSDRPTADERLGRRARLRPDGGPTVWPKLSNPSRFSQKTTRPSTRLPGRQLAGDVGGKAQRFLVYVLAQKVDKRRRCRGKTNPGGHLGLDSAAEGSGVLGSGRGGHRPADPHAGGNQVRQVGVAAFRQHLHVGAVGLDLQVVLHNEYVADGFDVDHAAHAVVGEGSGGLVALGCGLVVRIREREQPIFEVNLLDGRVDHGLLGELHDVSCVGAA